MTRPERFRVPLAVSPDLEPLTRPGGPFPLRERLIGGVPVTTFDRAPHTLREVFLSTREHAGDAVVYGDERWTYEEQWRIVVALAHQLQSRFGLGKGDRIALAARNYPEWIFTFWASQVIGAVIVPLNAWLTGPELSAIVAECEPALLVADEERLARLLDADPGLRLPMIGVRAAARSGVVPFPELTEGSDAGVVDPPACEIDDEDLATILYTSGTTGRPKGALGLHLNHAASLLNKYIRSVAKALESGTSSAANGAPVAHAVRLLSFPLFHISGINTVYTSAYAAHRIVLMHKWNAHEALELIERERVTELTGPPFVIRTLLDAAATSTRDLSSLAGVGMGGSQAPAALIQDIQDTFAGRVAPQTGYGLTETTSGVVAISGADFVAHPESVGRPLPTVEVALLDDEWAPVPPGVAGEIAIRGPQVVAGYFKQPAETARCFRDGWFRTGDTGRLDDDGYLTIVGRVKDVVIRGGENIYCAEVEARILEHPDVIEAAAFGIPHPTLGEQLCAVVRRQPGTSVDGADLAGFLTGRLAAYKVPARWLVGDEPLARTATGKLQKRDLASRLPAQP